MAERKIARVAPARAGAQIANAWRFWSQGDEFYAAARNAHILGKISFHGNGNWQFQTGRMMMRLAPGLKLSGNWTHALQLVFLVGDGVFLPLEQREDGITLIEVTPGKKLFVDLVVSSNSNVQHPIPHEVPGTLLKTLALRSGRVVKIIGRLADLTEQDFAKVAEVRANLRAGVSPSVPQQGEMYIEAALQSFHVGTGNVIQVVPVGAEVFFVTPSASAT